MNELIFEQKGYTAYLTINRPDSLNTFTDELVDAFTDKINEIGKRRDIRVVIIKGSGKSFCAGVDVKGKEYNPLNAREFLIRFNNLLNRLEELPQPSVSLIQGAAVAGGFELALASTFRFAVKESKFGLPEAKLGLVAAGGASFRLPRLVGFGKALEIGLTGDLIKGDEALQIGLINKLFNDYESMESEAEKFADKIASNAPLAISFLKDSFYKNLQNSVDVATLLEILSASVNHYSEDKKEGVKAFFEKRKPDFKGF